MANDAVWQYQVERLQQKLGIAERAVDDWRDTAERFRDVIATDALTIRRLAEERDAALTELAQLRAVLDAYREARGGE